MFLTLALRRCPKKVTNGNHLFFGFSWSRMSMKRTFSTTGGLCFSSRGRLICHLSPVFGRLPRVSHSMSLLLGPVWMKDLSMLICGWGAVTARKRFFTHLTSELKFRAANSAPDRLAFSIANTLTGSRKLLSRGLFIGSMTFSGCAK